jgi:predicted AAA+ superfamily ATPase
MDDKILFKGDIYLDQMIKLRLTDPVKVITGVRRCGKSTLLDMFEAHLLAQGIPASAIIRMNFEFIEFDSIKNYRDLAAYIAGRLRKGGKTLLLLDEVQQVEGWEKAVNSFRAKGNVDIYLSSAGRKTSHETIDSYLSMLEDAYFLYKARRYDIKGKEHLKSWYKYYIVDTGLRYWRLGKKNIDRGSVLENIVYLELLRKGYEVLTGRVSGPGGVTLEVDFIALKNGIKTYYQVTWTMQAPEVRKRELKPFGLIRDNYEKIILSLDKTPFTGYEGIKQINLIDFLLAG